MDRASFSSSCRSGLATVVKFFNSPPVKEGVKDFSGIVTCAFGFLEVYDLYKIIRGRRLSSESDRSVAISANKVFKNCFGKDLSKQASDWIVVAHKIIILSSKISIVLSAGVSRPGVFAISFLANKLFTTQQLQKAFGPNVTYAVNPTHPRHVVSIAAFVLSVPGTIQSVVKTAAWIRERIKKTQAIIPSKPDRWLTDCRLRAVVCFNFITSRPFLHLSNRLANRIVKG